MPSQSNTSLDIPISELMGKAKSDIEFPNYSNHVQVYITQNELTLDFYYLSIQQGKKPNVQAKHTDRIVLPLNIAKGLASALANAIAQHEEDNEVTLPDSRGAQPSDKFNLWP